MTSGIDVPICLWKRLEQNSSSISHKTAASRLSESLDNSYGSGG